MAQGRPDWEWYRLAMEAVAAGHLDEGEDAIEAALEAGHLWRVSLLIAPTLEPLRGRPRYERAAAEARRRAEARNLRPLVLTAMPSHTAPIAPLVLTLHGATGNARQELERWRAATDLGWIVAAGQSSQPATEDGFCWDPPRERVWQDMRAIAATLPAHARVVLAGFSQGAWIALVTALQAEVIVAGTVAMVGPFAGPDPNLPPAWRRLKISILVGARDTFREPVEELANQLRARDHHVQLEVIDEIGHEYPSDFTARIPALLRPPRVPPQDRADKQSG